MTEDSRYAELPDLLLQDPESLDRAGRGDIVLRAMETHGNCAYRHDRTLFHDRAPDAIRLLESIARNMEGMELGLLLRVLLLLPWEGMMRSSGLPVRASDVVSMLSRVAPHDALTAAIEETVMKGPACVARFRRSEVFPECRQAPAMVLEFDPEEGLSEIGRIEVDRLHYAVAKFRPFGWESNLRPIVPKWLMLTEPGKLETLLVNLVGRAEKKAQYAYGRFLALGLADWACEHVAHTGTEAVLDLLLAGRSGAVRKGAVDLAAAMERIDLLEGMARTDPDRGVRDRALKRLGRSPGQGDLFGREGTAG
jgi:hypothetical protein